MPGVFTGRNHATRRDCAVAEKGFVWRRRGRPGRFWKPSRSRWMDWRIQEETWKVLEDLPGWWGRDAKHGVFTGMMYTKGLCGSGLEVRFLPARGGHGTSFGMIRNTFTISPGVGLARLGGLAPGPREGAERYEVRRCRSSGRRKTADSGEPASCGALGGDGKTLDLGVGWQGKPGRRTRAAQAEY